MFLFLIELFALILQCISINKLQQTLSANVKMKCPGTYIYLACEEIGTKHFSTKKRR